MQYTQNHDRKEVLNNYYRIEPYVIYHAEISNNSFVSYNTFSIKKMSDCVYLICVTY